MAAIEQVIEPMTRLIAVPHSDGGQVLSFINTVDFVSEDLGLTVVMGSPA